jgi:hypothetical protein
LACRVAESHHQYSSDDNQTDRVVVVVVVAVVATIPIALAISRVNKAATTARVFVRAGHGGCYDYGTK